ncbi:nuclease-related domain-containing protein [Oceanobacillus longus]|uniref:Nuclease-related domain-containing protein n=1 Tax=Oceanobacillus longus TaxID=930120 RepID=A0ABV8H1Q6_9BACI
MSKRPKPLILQKYEALTPRIPQNFPRLSEIQYELAKSHKGYIGEIKVDYYLSMLAQRYTILPDVCLKVNGQTFQIDNLLITDHAIYLIEVKNYNGKIIFNTILNQFTRDDGENETGFHHPITQVEFQQIKLQNWLQERSLLNRPIYYLIAISNPETIIEVIGNQEAIAKVVARGEHIPKKIMDIEQSLTDRSTLPHQKLGYEIKRECINFDKDIMAKHGVKMSDLLPGVQCPECGRLGMERIYANWLCPRCNKHSKHAHKRAIYDYLLCSGNAISNKECMRFLKINSRSLATRLLQSSNLAYQKEHKIWIKLK